MKEVTIKIIIFLLALAFFGFNYNIAKADPDFYHQRNILPGAKAAGMGGAYTALSNDPAGAYYNPAGMVFGKSKEISLSVNSRQEKTIKFKNIDALNGEDFVENSSNFFPSFVGSSYKLGFISIGWSYLTLDASNIDQSDRFENLDSNGSNVLRSYNRTHQESNNYLLAGASASIPIGKNFSIGSSFYYYRRDIIATNHQLVQLIDGSFLTSDQKYTTINEGIYPIYGAMFRLEQISIGVSYRQPQSLSDRTELHSDDVVYNASIVDSIPQITSDVYQLKSYDEVNPETSQLGVAWLPSKNFTLSADIIFHSAAVSPSKIKENNLVDTWNYAAGGELSIGFITFRAGYFTNNSQAQKLDSGKVNQPTNIDYTGTTFSMGLKQKGFNGSIVYVEQNGIGQSQKLSDDSNIQKVLGYSRTVQLGTTYDF